MLYNTYHDKDFVTPLLGNKSCRGADSDRGDTEQ